MRYVLVELLTALLFFLAFLKMTDWPVADALGLAGTASPVAVPVYCLVVSGLILGTFVDFEHMIIPDRVTLGGVVLGLVLSPLVPELQGKTTWTEALIASALGAGLV